MIDPKTKLSEHFTLAEMTASASHPEIYNVPPLTVVDNLVTVCQWLEDLRAAYNIRYAQRIKDNGERIKDVTDEPLLINSGYRSKTLNKVVGGALNSNHLTGCAADIRCRGKDANERAQMALRYATLLIEIADKRKQRFDELIIERKGVNWWVHFAVRPDNNRMWITVINKS